MSDMHGNPTHAAVPVLVSPVSDALHSIPHFNHSNFRDASQFASTAPIYIPISKIPSAIPFTESLSSTPPPNPSRDAGEQYIM